MNDTDTLRRFANQLAEQWAGERYTEAEPAERDLVLWMLERLSVAWSIETLFRVADQHRNRQADAS